MCANWHKMCVAVFIAISLFLMGGCQHHSGFQTVNDNGQTHVPEKITTSNDDGETIALEKASDLCAYVDITQDEYLSTLPRDKAVSSISVRAIHLGSYSSPSANEILALFSVSTVPHSGGLDRTIMVLLNTVSKTPVAQATIVGDSVELYQFESAAGQRYPLFICTGGWQGNYRYAIHLFEFSEDGCQEKEINSQLTILGEETKTPLCFSVTGGSLLHVFSVIDGGLDTPAIYNYQVTLKWDRFASEFTDIF